MCWLLSCLFLFFYPCFPIVVQMSFTIDTCVFFSLMCTLEDHDDQSYSYSPILVFSQKHLSCILLMHAFRATLFIFIAFCS
jgi:hypothetical protein